jgi:hypothetical protein
MALHQDGLFLFKKDDAPDEEEGLQVDWAMNGEYQYTQYYNADTSLQDVVEGCFESIDGRLFVFNDEYGTCQVNFCPFCGFEAKVKIVPKTGV